VVLLALQVRQGYVVRQGPQEYRALQVLQVLQGYVAPQVFPDQLALPDIRALEALMVPLVLQGYVAPLVLLVLLDYLAFEGQQVILAAPVLQVLQVLQVFKVHPVVPVLLDYRAPQVPQGYVALLVQQE
jgi:hypothetical protein